MDTDLLYQFCDNFKQEMDDVSFNLIRDTLKLNGFTSKLSLSLLDEGKARSLFLDTGLKAGPLLVFEHFIRKHNVVSNQNAIEDQATGLTDQSPVNQFNDEIRVLGEKISVKKENLAQLQGQLNRKLTPVDPIDSFGQSNLYLTLRGKCN